MAADYDLPADWLTSNRNTLVVRKHPTDPRTTASPMTQAGSPRTRVDRGDRLPLPRSGITTGGSPVSPGERFNGAFALGLVAAFIPRRDVRSEHLAPDVHPHARSPAPLQKATIMTGSTNSPREILIALVNAVDGKDAEFNEWYSDTHIPEVVALPGFVSAQRYEYASDAPTPYRYATVYEIEGSAAEAQTVLFGAGLGGTETQDLLQMFFGAFAPIGGPHSNNPRALDG
ncbi:DUF4286 family protein [Arthrobacter sp. BE255]|uniref:DUF4286 family protein n=1 Tax=Arthrobacter sp. BE255 TaxID=2817721 RepID=UPI00285EEE4F|nr:DUF4286 family protein [Arthrobacter sp. BE255]MDR7159934.1 hypothetical protein [Arthrobacter sp. BE255]